MKIALLPVLAAVALTATAQTKVVDGVLTDSKGMTLYVWNNDTIPGKSQCSGVCTMSWPPLLAKEGEKATGDLSLVDREDGKQQWAHRGKPLYLFANDEKPGDRKGDGFRAGTWNIVKP